MMAARDQQAVEAAVTDDRRVVGRRGPEAGGTFDQLELGDLRQRPIGLAQQLVDAAGGDANVEAAVLDGRPDDHLLARPRHE